MGLGLLGLYVVMIFGVGYLGRRRLGLSPFRLRRLRGTMLAATMLVSLGLALVVSGPVVGLVGSGSDSTLFANGAAQVVGVVLFLIALGIVAVAQRAMGMSWRVGVDTRERTELVTTGPFRLIRNPIYSALVAMAAAEALITSNIVSVAALFVILVGVITQVRLVEEPYLARIHGQEFTAHCTTTGRFVPGLGRAPVPAARAAP